MIYVPDSTLETNQSSQLLDRKRSGRFGKETWVWGCGRWRKGEGRAGIIRNTSEKPERILLHSFILKQYLIRRPPAQTVGLEVIYSQNLNGSFDAEVVEDADNFQGQQVILLKRKGELININVLICGTSTSLEETALDPGLKWHIWHILG